MNTRNLNYGSIIYSAILAREMPSGMSRILFMISKMNILGPIYMKDFSYKKMGTSALPYILAILIADKEG